ncbi:MAG: universal stress protein [Anaerolineae bacterium]|uniref:universal stress protein n=2 Tax=Candidatus Amarolinea dominans TaxID=3140696 RepID=UPI0031376121|nr:universal stress protein [Anaerolineae bacterium]MBK9096201.1 universal stress protein [Anaerolineae bacterium]MBK9231003.1 universal stress protein [Anaerolineae bacterium]
MYRHILVPLDGSAFAEQALPHVQALVAASPEPVDVYLLSVAPLLQDRSVTMVSLYPFYISQDHLDMARRELEQLELDLRAYLTQVAAQINDWGAPCHVDVRYGHPAEEVLALAAAVQADLIVMSTHGRSGINRWVFGSVADKLLRQATVPVLLIRAREITGPLAPKYGGTGSAHPRA